jgi:predicted nucleic acid-binding Zn ribbon protein
MYTNTHNGAPVPTMHSARNLKTRPEGLNYAELGMVVRKAIVEGRIVPGPVMQICDDDPETPKIRNPRSHGTRNCKVCGSEYEALSYTVQTCGDKCRHIARSESAKARHTPFAREVVQCVICGVNPTSSVKSTTCSNECRVLLKRQKSLAALVKKEGK